MPDVQILAGGVAAAPLDYLVPQAQEIIVKAMHASFDGSGAGSSWIPAVQIVSPAGKVVGTYLASGQVAAGASADVSWFPSVGAAGGDGIRFNTDNEGGWLDITLNDVDPNGRAMQVTDTTGQGIGLSSPGFGIIDLLGGGSELQIFDTVFLAIAANGSFQVFSSQTNTTWLRVNEDGTVTVGAAGGDTHIRGDNIDTLSQTVDIAGTTSIRLAPATGAGQLFADAGIWFLDARAQTTFGVRIWLGTGSRLEVGDHNGAAIFRVNEDGSLQGKTGKALTFNL